MIVRGEIAGGSRINEVQLSRELGVSRTPLREAIASLVREQTLVTVPRVGAFVKQLTVEDFEQIYSIRTLLDPEALRLAGIPPASHIHKLERVNDRIRAASDPDKIIELDDEWHLLLVAHCPNEVLLDLIRDFMRRTRRYELALMREQKNVSIATDEHDAIATSLRAGNLDEAMNGLRLNMQSGFPPIVDWLRQREAAEDNAQ